MKLRKPGGAVDLGGVHHLWRDRHSAGKQDNGPNGSHFQMCEAIAQPRADQR